LKKVISLVLVVVMMLGCIGLVAVVVGKKLDHHLRKKKRHHLRKKKRHRRRQKMVLPGMTCLYTPGLIGYKK